MRLLSRLLIPLGLLGARSQIQYQPKGVIGVISPWNFPVNLTFAPLAGVFAAGNRCMIKPSEFTEVTSEVMKKAIAQYYDEEEVAVITCCIVYLANNHREDGAYLALSQALTCKAILKQHVVASRVRLQRRKRSERGLRQNGHEDTRTQ